MVYNNNNNLKDRLNESEVSCGSGDQIFWFWKLVIQTVTNVASDVRNVSKRIKGFQNKNVWFDSQVRKAVNEKNKAWLDWLSEKGRVEQMVLGNYDRSIKVLKRE